jgi:hypothetical protein
VTTVRPQVIAKTTVSATTRNRVRFSSTPTRKQAVECRQAAVADPVNQKKPAPLAEGLFFVFRFVKTHSAVEYPWLGVPA